VLFEAKVLAYASCTIGFDILRNRITRNIDVMIRDSRCRSGAPTGPASSSSPRVIKDPRKAASTNG
jgi:hypothetical protein